MRTSGVVPRVRRSLATRGVAGAAKVAVERAGRFVRADEDHVWLRADLGGAGDRALALPAGLRARPGGAADAAQAESLGQNPLVVREHLDLGMTLHLVLDGDEPVSICRVYRSRAPMLAAAGGWMEIPSGVAVLEDCATAPARRGEGIGPALWTQVAAGLEAEGLAALLTKVRLTNEASRRAMAKAGFREIAVMRYRRNGRVTHVRVEALGDDPPAHDLAARLTRG